MTPQYIPAELPPVFPFFFVGKYRHSEQFGRAEDTRQDVPVEDRMFSQRLLLNSGQAYFLLNVSTVLKRKYIKVWMQHKKTLFMFLQHRPFSLSNFLSGYLDNPMAWFVCMCHWLQKHMDDVIVGYYELFSRCWLSKKSEIISSWDKPPYFRDVWEIGKSDE